MNGALSIPSPYTLIRWTARYRPGSSNNVCDDVVKQASLLLLVSSIIVALLKVNEL